MPQNYLSLTYPYPYKTLDGAAGAGTNATYINGIFTGSITVALTTTTGTLIVTNTGTAYKWLGIGSINGKLQSSQQNTWSNAASAAEAGFQALSDDNNQYVDFNIMGSTNATPDFGVIRANANAGLIITSIGTIKTIDIKPGGTSAIQLLTAGGINLPQQTASKVLVTDGSKNMTTLGYGSAPVASELVQRDANNSTTSNNPITSQTTTTLTANATVTTLSVSSTGLQYFKETGVGNYTGCTCKLPAATSLVNGQSYIVNQNCGTTSVVVQTSLAAAIVTAAPGSYITFIVIDNTTNVAASWDYHVQASTGTTWSASTLATSAIINASNGLNGTVGAVTPNTGNFTSIGVTTAGTGKFTTIQTTTGNSTIQNLGSSAAFYLQNATSGTGQVSLFPGTSGAITWRYPVTDGTAGDYLVSGAGTVPMTWYTPVGPSLAIYTATNASISLSASAVYHVIEMIGGGAGTAGNGTSPGAAGAAGDSTLTFTGATGTLTCKKGSPSTNYVGGAGGTVSTNTMSTALLGTADLRVGQDGSYPAVYNFSDALTYVAGGAGGGTLFGFGAPAGQINGAGLTAIANSGGGASGPSNGTTTTVISGGGGGSGGYAKIYISSAVTALNYTQGAGGTAGTAGSGGGFAGGAGGSGKLHVTSYFQ